MDFDGADDAVATLDRLCRLYEGEARRLAAAVELAGSSHHGQRRKSGDPYITHPLAVAEIVAEWRMDAASVVAALLHDVVEDTDVTLDLVTETFGPEIAALVDGLTKLDGVKLVGNTDQIDAHAAANLQKLLLAVADDPRVLIVKLADRLHNIRTLGALPAPKAARIARETMDVHAPLAHRLGMAGVTAELEDLCFEVLHPLRYRELRRQVLSRLDAGRFRLEKVRFAVEEQLRDADVDATVTARTKHLWSVYEKMVVKQRPLEEIYDLAGLRVIVHDVPACYAALGVIHNQYQPIAGRFKDWVAAPKFNNMYQSLHTTVIADGGTPVEVQIRTQAMHHRAEWGVAAHWRYKEDGAGIGDAAEWLKRTFADDGAGVDATQSPTAYLEHVRANLAGDEIYCFTPRGDVISLPLNSSCIDFAYAVHTEVGHHCTGAKVNGRIVPLATTLRTGDRVEIVTASGSSPKEDWLSVVRSGRARSRIRHWLLHEPKDEEQLERGRAALSEAFTALGVPQRFIRPDALESVATLNEFNGAHALLAAIGSGHCTADRIARQMAGVAEPDTPRNEAGDERKNRRHKSKAADTLPVAAEGLSGIRSRTAGCCRPVHGDHIVGYVIDGVLEVHRAVCTKAPQQRLAVEVTWVGQSTVVYVELRVEAIDRDGLLADVTTAIAAQGAAIVASNTATGKDMVARERFTLRLGDVSLMDSVLAAVLAVDGVFAAQRT